MTVSIPDGGPTGPDAPSFLSRSPHPSSFGDLARIGANAWWRYVVAIAVIFAGGFSSVAVAAYAVSQAGGANALAGLAGPMALERATFNERLIGFLFLIWGIVAFLPWMRVVLPNLHQRTWRSFLTASPKIRWGLVARSFLVMTALSGIGLALQLALAPDEVVIRAPDAQFLVMALIGAAVLPLQVLTEEVLFRGYLYQLTGRLTHRAAIRVLLPAALFTLAHMGNPETTHDVVWSLALYAAAALYLGLLVYRTNGLEASAGLHLGSNLFVLLIASPSVSVFPVHAVVTDVNSDFRASFAGSIVIFCLHYYFVCRKSHRSGL